MTPPPPLSVVVPTRNSARTLERCLQAVRRQTLAVELIVVDNHSTDDTAMIAAAYADLVEVAGPERSAQRNRGARLARGRYLLFLDSDQVLDPEVAEEAVRLLDVAPQLAALVVPEVAEGRGFWAACRRLEKALYLGEASVEAARVFRREIFDRVGGFDTTLSGLEDWELTDRVRGGGGVLGRVRGLVRHDEDGLTLLDSFRKKRYYGQGGARYVRSGMRGRWWRLRHRSQLLQLARHPVLAAGLVILKSVEAAGFALGAARARTAR